MMMYDLTDLMFVVGTGHQGLMTEIWLLERDKVIDRDPEGLNPIDSSQLIGVPHQFIRTPAGVKGLASFMGSGEQAREAFTAIGIEEAPIAWDKENDCLAYVTKDSDTNSRIAPRTRVLYRMEKFEDGIKATRFTFFHRFPGEDDWPATSESLNGTVAAALPDLDENGSFITIHDQKLVSEWLSKAKIQHSEN